MVALKGEMGLKEISAKPEDSIKSLKTKFGIFGEEMIEKEVKPSGNTGRVYLPLDWVGKHVKIIRIDGGSEGWPGNRLRTAMINLKVGHGFR